MREKGSEGRIYREPSLVTEGVADERIKVVVS